MIEFTKMTIFDKLDIIGAILFAIYCSYYLIVFGTLSHFQIWILIVFSVFENIKKHFYKFRLKKNEFYQIQFADHV